MPLGIETYRTKEHDVCKHILYMAMQVERLSGIYIHHCQFLFSLSSTSSILNLPIWFSRCSTAVETVPPAPAYSSSGEQQLELQTMRVLIGAPLKHPPKHLVVGEALLPVFPSIDSESINLKAQQILGSLSESNFIDPPGLSNFVVYCTTDFTTVSKEVDIRTRRVRLVGLEVLILKS